MERKKVNEVYLISKKVVLHDGTKATGLLSSRGVVVSRDYLRTHFPIESPCTMYFNLKSAKEKIDTFREEDVASKSDFLDPSIKTLPFRSAFVFKVQLKTPLNINVGEIERQLSRGLLDFDAEIIPINIEEHFFGSMPGFMLVPDLKMPLSFFRGLLPTSRNSGTIYSLGAPEMECQRHEIIDDLVSDTFRTATKRSLDYFTRMRAVYELAIGDHYDIDLRGQFTCKGGSKGLADYLIFPLIARKLIADSCLHERREHHFLNAASWVIALPLELARFSAGVAITLLLAPIFSIMHLIMLYSAEPVTPRSIAPTL